LTMGSLKMKKEWGTPYYVEKKKSSKGGHEKKKKKKHYQREEDIVGKTAMVCKPRGQK